MPGGRELLRGQRTALVDRFSAQYRHFTGNRRSERESTWKKSLLKLLAWRPFKSKPRTRSQGHVSLRPSSEDVPAAKPLVRRNDYLGTARNPRRLRSEVSIRVTICIRAWSTGKAMIALDSSLLEICNFASPSALLVSRCWKLPIVQKNTLASNYSIE